VADLGSPGGSRSGAPHSSIERNKERLLKNDKFDEALEVSASHASSEFTAAASKPSASAQQRAAAALDRSDDNSSEGRDDGEAKGLPVKNDQFDAAFELSSGDDDSSVETTLSEKQAPRKRYAHAVLGVALSTAALASIGSSTDSNSFGVLLLLRLSFVMITRCKGCTQIRTICSVAEII
jgi:hypothetical protein